MHASRLRLRSASGTETPMWRAGCSRKPTLFPLFIHLCDTPTPKPPSLFHHLWPPTKLRFGSFDVNQSGSICWIQLWMPDET